MSNEDTAVAEETRCEVDRSPGDAQLHGTVFAIGMS